MMNPKNTKKSIGRLQKRSDFLRVQQISNKKNKKWVSKTAIIQLADNDGGLRYGLTVSKRVDKRAVARNRIKRRLRAVLDDLLKGYIHHDLDVVVIGRALTLTASIEDIERDVQWCLKRMDVKPACDA